MKRMVFGESDSIGTALICATRKKEEGGGREEINAGIG